MTDVYTAPFHAAVSLDDLLAPYLQGIQTPEPNEPPTQLPASQAQQAPSVPLAGGTMEGPLYLSPLMPTAPSQAATRAYCDAVVATAPTQAAFAELEERVRVMELRMAAVTAAMGT